MIGKERVLIAAYGSLKEGFYNHPALGEDAELKGKTTVIGWMYLTGGGYPRLYHEYMGQWFDGLRPVPTTYEVEIYSVNVDAYEGIRYMELGAGYNEEELLTEWGTAKIYWSKPEAHSPNHKSIKAYNIELFQV